MSTYEKVLTFNITGSDTSNLKHAGNYPTNAPTYTSIEQQYSLSLSGGVNISSADRDALVSAKASVRRGRSMTFVSSSYSYDIQGYFEIQDNNGNSDKKTQGVGGPNYDEMNWDATTSSKRGYYSVNARAFIQGNKRATPKMTGYSEGDTIGSIRNYLATSPIRLTLTLEHRDPTIENLATSGVFWERPITVNWRSDYQDGYEYEAYYNNVKIKEGSGLTETEFILPAHTFNGKTLPSSIKVRTYNTRPDGVRVYSNWSEKSLSLKDIEATISNLLVEGEFWEENILVSWRSTDQQQYKIEVLKSNLVVAKYTGDIATQFVIPKNTLEKGQYIVIVTVAYENRFVNSNERSINLKDILPSVSGLTLSGSNIDLPINLNWVSQNQQKYEVEVFKDSVSKFTASGTTPKTQAFPHSTFTAGQHIFKVRVGYKDRWSEWVSISAVLVETVPSIGILEPDGIVVDKNIKNRIWWTSNNQTKFKLTLDSQSPIEGATDKEYFLEAGSLTVGKHEIALEVIYVTSAGVEKKTSKKASFIVQGKPPTPTITSSNLFSVSRPVITWDTQDQQGYILRLTQDGKVIWSTGWINGLVTRQKVLSFIKDGRYTAELKIINEFSIESEWSFMDISITTAVSETINMTLTQHPFHVALEWDNQKSAFDFFYVLRNGQPIAKVENDVVYNDYTAIHDQTYQILGVTRADIGKYSNEVSINFQVDGCYAATIDKLDDLISVGQNYDSFVFQGDVTYEHNVVPVSGREFGISVFGEHRADTYNFSFVELDQISRFLLMCNRRKPFCYRGRVNKVFIVINAPRFRREGMNLDYTITAHRIDYNEVIEYD